MEIRTLFLRAFVSSSSAFAVWVLPEKSFFQCTYTHQAASETTTIIQSGEAPFLTGEEPPPHSGELNHALSQVGGPIPAIPPHVVRTPDFQGAPTAEETSFVFTLVEMLEAACIQKKEKEETLSTRKTEKKEKFGGPKGLQCFFELLSEIVMQLKPKNQIFEHPIREQK